MSAMSVAVVSGAGSGMGEATARRFLDGGWGVLGLDVSESSLSATGGRLPEAQRGRFHPAVVDVTSRDAVRSALEALEGGTIRAAVTVAGIYPPTNLDTFTEDKYRKTFDVNFLGTLNVAAEAIDSFRAVENGGAIVTISSADAFTASTQQLLYSASKAAVVSLTRVLAATVAGEGIVVNGIAPGWVNTPGNKATGRMSGAEKLVPVRRVAQPSEIAEWAWRLSDGSLTFVTGETIKVTGGELMSQ